MYFMKHMSDWGGMYLLDVGSLSGPLRTEVRGVLVKCILFCGLYCSCDYIDVMICWNVRLA